MHIRLPITTKSIATAKAKTSLAHRLVLGFVSAAMVAVVGSAGVAAAQAVHSQPVAKSDCAHWESFGFKNYGECVAWVASHSTGHGYGYGGSSNNQISSNLNLNINGSNNVITLVINYFFGR